MDSLCSFGQNNMILGSNPHAQYLAYKAEIDQAVQKVLESGWYILGDEVKQFENEFAQFNGCNYSIGVGSGTEALHLALAACEIGEGDEVITVSHTAVATVAAIGLCGATPVFADIDPLTFTLSPNELTGLITEKTKAILPVHLYGHPANMTEICAIAKQHNLYIIEDCAQAHGATIEGKKVGTLADLGCYSFYPTKNLSALGDGGAVVTNNLDLAEKVSLLREYGWKERFISQIEGWNSRLDEVQAAILRVKLKYLDQTNRARQTLAKLYQDQLKNTAFILPKEVPGFEHVFHLYVVRSKHRDKLLQFLKHNNIAAGIHYAVPVHLQPAYQKLNKNQLPETVKACEEIISLPMYPELSNQIEWVIEKMLEFDREYH